MTDVELETPTYSTAEVCRMANVSYRMVDWWLRRGCIRIEHDADGSGSRRRWTHAEMIRLIEIVAIYREATAVLHQFQSGELWRRAA